ncbi:DUF1367 family protein [Hydrogenophaga sp. 2FB]|uniref:DUF1367 family protein n=1 Tax=Hydrogenophaga sp. 2FB TaxID=2502187 RepID=UPI0010F55D9C|nr:DUF1367 family protein [Hydrogenophaga sp. 2FB]
MSKVVIIKNDQGRLEGIDLQGQRAYQKWRRLVTDLPVGQTLSFSYRMPRSPAHHRLFFAKLNSLLARTEAFTELDKLRYWIVMGAGYFDLVPGFDGKPNAIPRSLDFESMDEVEFGELHRQVDSFLWGPRAQQTLWPHLDEEGRYRCVESFLREFE